MALAASAGSAPFALIDSGARGKSEMVATRMRKRKQGGGVAEGAGDRRTRSPSQAAHERPSGQETTSTTTTMTTATLADLFEVAAKAAHAERRRDFEERKLREERKGIEVLEAQLRAARERAAEHEAKLSERERACASLSRDVDAHRAVDWSRELPDALWEKIAGRLAEEEAVFPFALTCRRFREVQKRVVASSGGKRRLRSKVKAGRSGPRGRYGYD